MNIGYINTKAVWSLEEQKESIQRKAIELNITIDTWYFESASYYYTTSPEADSHRIDFTTHLNSGDIIITHSLFILAVSSRTITRKLNQVLKNKSTIISVIENIKIDNSISLTNLLDILEDISYYKYNKNKQKIYKYPPTNKINFNHRRWEELKGKIPLMKNMYKNGTTLYNLMQIFKISYRTLVYKIIPQSPEFMELFNARRHRGPQSRLLDRPLKPSRLHSFNRNLLLKQLNNQKMISEDK
jgi:hypothetical protein